MADTPYGPFRDPVAIQGADGDSIDPAVFIDDDGQAYYYWGQFELRGAKLKPDMRELDMSTYHGSIVNEWEHGFHEGDYIILSIRIQQGEEPLVCLMP